MKRILLVEDDPNLRTVIRMVLEQAGYGVTEAAHGGEALAALGRLTPDVVIADLTMPVIDGDELLNRIRAEPDTRLIPVLLLSGNQDRARALSEADSVLIKPFEPDDLVSTIERLSARTRLQ